MRFLVTVVGVVLLVSTTLSVNPGFRTAVSLKGLDYIRQVAVPMLEKYLSTLSIPNITGSASSPIGHIEYSLHDIKLSDLKIPTSSITPNKSLIVYASGVSMHIFADWKYRMKDWPHITGHGSCDVTVSSVILQVYVNVGADSKGHPTVSAANCYIDIPHIKIDFHGGASWLYNLFSSYIANDFKKTLESEVCKETVGKIDTAGNAALESIEVEVKLPDHLTEIDFALLQAPICATTYLETDHKGEFFLLSHPVEAPFTPQPLPPIVNSTKMMNIWLTDYIANTAGFVYQTGGVLQYNITPHMALLYISAIAKVKHADGLGTMLAQCPGIAKHANDLGTMLEYYISMFMNIPSGIPFKLNTSSFEALIPELYRKFPNMAMVLGLVATAPPTLKVNPNTANFTVPGRVNVFVLDQNNTAEVAFVLGMMVYADVKVWIHANGTKEVISANATFLKEDLSLVSSNIGQFDVTVLQAAADLLSTAFIIPAVNHYANIGIPLPAVDGVSLVNPDITFGEGHVMISTDLSYKPSFEFLDKLYRKQI